LRLSLPAPAALTDSDAKNKLLGNRHLRRF
jgi:hypothetical protein